MLSPSPIETCKNHIHPTSTNKMASWIDGQLTGAIRSELTNAFNDNVANALSYHLAQRFNKVWACLPTFCWDKDIASM